MIFTVKNYSIAYFVCLCALITPLFTPTLPDPYQDHAHHNTVALSRCTSYAKYPHRSFEHEYVYGGQELAEQFKHALGNKKDAFLLGASTSEHQCSKQCTPACCDWSRFAHKRGLKEPTHADYVGNLWDNYETYIDQLKDKLGINALRISIEWPLVQPIGPRLADVDTSVLDHYAQLIAYLVQKDITPVICFHHYTSPCWFADRGGFETKHNCAYFADYCAYTYQYIMEQLCSEQLIVDRLLRLEKNKRGILWATFNAPEGVAFKGYCQQEGPPASAEKKGLSWVIRVLKNMLESHVQAYQKIKGVARSLGYYTGHLLSPKIGFLKNISQCDPVAGLSFPVKQITELCCAIAQDINNDCVYRFFTTGVFRVKTPFVAKTHYNRHAPASLDWIGLNYYSHQQLRVSERVIARSTDPVATDNSNYRLYPHGLFRALSEINEHLAAPLSIPIYVTENGVATQDQAKRNRFYKTYLHELLRAIQHGIPVSGYLTWTAFDNYEWPKTKNSSNQQRDRRVYGLTTVSDDGLTLTVKEGSQYFKTFATSFLWV